MYFAPGMLDKKPGPLLVMIVTAYPFAIKSVAKIAKILGLPEKLLRV